VRHGVADRSRSVTRPGQTGGVVEDRRRGLRDGADDVVQALVVARGNLELGRSAEALEALDRALQRARILLAQLSEGPPRRDRRSGG